MNIQESQYLKTPQILSRFQISRATLGRWRTTPSFGFPKAIRFGDSNVNYYEVSDIDEFAERFKNKCCGNVAA